MANAGVALSRRNTTDPRLTACPECDLVQREPVCPEACTVSCPRCGALLYRSVPRALDMTLALTLATAIAFTIANILPVMSLELQGRQVSPTLFGLVRTLNDAGMAHIGVLVLMTIVLMPGLEILARLYLLVPLHVGRVPKGIALVSQLLGSFKVWSMTEVFVLGAVVSIHRLRQIAELEIEPGFWAIGAVMVLIAMTDSVFDTRALWARAAGGPA